MIEWQLTNIAIVNGIKTAIIIVSTLLFYNHKGNMWDLD